MLQLIRKPLRVAAALAALTLAPLAQAKNVYVAVSGAVSGLGVGLSVGAPGSLAWFNNPASWSALASLTQINPGDTVHLRGTITPLGAGATATATVSGGHVTAFNLVTGGAGYLNPSNSPSPAATAEIFGGGGSGATATVTVSVGGVVTGIALTSGGTGYTSAPSVLIIGAGLTVEASGTSTAPITILFDPGATMTAPVWPSATGAINLNSENYITIDGGATGTIGGASGSPLLANGSITNTANGSAKTNQAPSIFIYAPNSTHITIQNLLLADLYDRTSSTDLAPATGARSYSAITSFYNGSGAPSNWKVYNCIIHDAYSGFFITYGPGSSNIEYSTCTAYNCDWGGNAGDYGTGATLSSLLVHDNYFHDWANWDDTTGTNDFHHNGFFAWGVSGGTATGVSYYNNVVGPNFGVHASSGMFIQGWVASVLCYNNIFVENPNDNPNDGLIFLNPYPDIVGTYSAYNNTFVGQGIGTGVYFGPDVVGGHTTQSAQTINMENNLFTGVATAVALYSQSASITVNANYNLGYNLNPALQYSYSTTNSSLFQTFAQWQARGYDVNGTSANPNLNANYVPVGPSAAIDAGTNLSAFFATDIAGTVRPQGTGWDIGAYEVVQSAPVVVTPPAPEAVTYGGTVSFPALVFGQAPLSYQWQVSANGGSTWTNLTDGPLGDGAVISGSATATLTISGATLDLNNNQYEVTATDTVSSVTSTAGILTATPAPQTITFPAFSPVAYGAAPFALTATANSGLTPSYTSSNTSVATVSSNVAGTTITIVGGGTSLITANQGGNANYLAAPAASQTITVTGEGQTITFGSLSPVTYGVAPFALTASASSGLTPTYTSSNTAVATVSGNTLTIVGGGTTTITANQIGNASYLAAPGVSQTLTVNPATQTITFAAPATHTFGDSGFQLGATASSHLTVSYASSNPAVATVNNVTGVATVVGAGTTTITATQTGSASYLAAPALPQTLTVNQASQQIIFSLSSTVTYGVAPIALNGTVNSSLTVTYTSSNTAVATVSGSTLTIVGAGSVTITALQTGDANHLAATSAPRPLTVNKASQTITFAATASQEFGAPPFSPGATINSVLAITYTSSNTTVATVSGGLLTLLHAGTTTITASQSGNANYNAATSVAQTLTVTPAQTPVITSAAAASGITGNSFSYAITALNYPTSFNATGLPAGLTVNTGTGVISGTPTAGGIFTVALSAANTGGTGTGTVTLTLAAAPSISTQPASQTITAGSPLSLSVVASGGGIPVTYQWQVSINGGATWTNLSDGGGISGSTTANLLISSAAGWLNGFEYQCIVTSSVGATISAAATITVNAASSSSVFFGSIGGASGTSSISALSHIAGSPGVGSNFAAELNAAGTGGTLMGYISSLGDGFVVSFTLSPTGSFIAKASSFAGVTTPGQALTFNGQIASGTISGTIAELSLPFSAALDAASGSSATVSGYYQGVAIGSSGAIYSIVGTQGEVYALAVTSAGVSAGVGTASGNGTFTVVAQNGATIAATVNQSTNTLTGTTTQSVGGVISFSGVTGLPAFTVMPQSETVGTTRSIAFNASASGAPAYQWTFNGTAISGAIDPVLLLSNTNSGNAGSYACVATNSNGSVTSTAAVLTVTATSNPGYLINLSARANVGTGNNILIGGFGVGGSGTKQLLVRGVGPALSAFFTNDLATPQLTLLDTTGAVVATNLGWGSASVPGSSTASESPVTAGSAIMSALGAYPYTAGSVDTAMVITMPAGNNTAQLSGVGGTTGVALCEIYDADTGIPTAHLVNISARADVGTGNNILIGGFVIGGATAETVLIRAVGPGLNDLLPGVFPLSVLLNQPVLTILDHTGAAIYTNTIWGGDATIAGTFGTTGAFTLVSGHADSVLLVTLPPGNYTAQVSGLNGGTGIALCEIYEVQ